ncbi:defective chorion-1 protein, FC125 isoform isoform X3 [Drosophila guanche]|uniref:defective chorion-1 protein, FC125 isoform isoform X3 n=1 Tax=Drosophila guanche TaxID=7266 RepID=UPI00147253A1|nr:defective chorion-1 protein, FC125 isoform isoform X3 [Drosophila guanche]
MRLQCLLLLAPCLALVVLGQETAPQATVTTGDAGEQENPNNGTADTKPRMPTEETILGQMPPITPLRSGVPSLDAFYMLFPALGSLLRWGALFPAPTILGAVPDSLQPTAAASKVVLVLADDPTAKTRVPRQDAPPPTNPFGQFLAQMPNANFAQGLMNPANFNPDNFNLGQMAPNVGQALTNMQLPPMPTMPQFGFENILGAAPPPPPAALPPAPAEPAPPADKPADEPNAPVAAPNPFAFLNPSNFDMNQMLGQAQQSLPQMPSGVDFFSNLRQMWPGAPPASPAPGSEGQASDISEIRVRPEEAAYSQENNLDEKERVPLLWFRMPMNRQGDEGESKPLEDLRVEAKLRAFERQVIAELKMLQQIERVAREMRSSAASSRGSSTSGSPFKISYPLSRTPVHKITRADIEQALRDDYVRRLLHKEAQRKSRANHAAFKRQTMPADASMSKEDIVKIMAYAYRMATEQQTAEKNKEDKIYAAYRATGDKPQQQERQMQQQPMMMQQQPMPQMQQRQWEAEKQEAKMQQNPMMMMQQEQQRQWEAEQNEAKMQQQRQMMAEQRPMMIQQQQRQWEAEQKEAKIQQIPMMMQQRQWEAVQKEAKIQQNPMMMQQRQWEVEQQQQRQMMAEHAQMQQQPMMHMQQRMEQQQQQQHQPMMQEPMRIEQQPMMMQQRQMAMEPPQMQQNPMMQMQQRQWEAEQKEAKLQQQRQWEAEQNEAKMQQQQRQWEAEKQEAKIQQNPMMMQQQRQWEAEKQEAKIQQNPMMMQQQRQMTMDPMQMQQLDSARQWGEPQGDAGEEGEAMLGEAEPQMPEVPGQARHKGVDMLGLGGNKRKKSKHGQGSPTVINYYAVQQQQQRPQPSYGTSYGGGGYGSNAYGGGGYSSGGYSSGGYSSGGHSSGGYSSGGHSSGGYSSGGYRAALGNEEVDEMLRQHQTMARTINPGNPNGVQQQEQEERSINQTTPQLTPTQRLHKSQSSASTASESESETESESDPVLGSKYSFKEGILQPYMGLLPISHPDDPWTHKAYDPHHALYTGGGSYAAYLKDNDGRRRRDTHIMPQLAHQRSLLTPDMLERLLRIKIEFQRRFPHLYKTMLSHHTNQTRVEVQPPVLGRKTAVLKEAKPKYASDEGPVYELGAAERGLFEEEEEDQAEAAADPEPNLDIKESQESSNNNNDDEGMDTSGRKEQDDNELDYFNFDDDDDDTDNIDD